MCARVCVRVCARVCVCMCVRARSVAELMMYVDVTGKPRLGMNRGSRLPRQAQKGCRGKKDEEHLVAFAPFQLSQVRQTVEAWMEQALKDSVRTVTPGSRSLGPNALASPGLLGSADSGGLHGACAQRQCQNLRLLESMESIF